MSIKQNKDESIIKSTGAEVASIGRIEATFTPIRNKEIEEKYSRWVEECANTTKPCSHTIQETEEYFLQQCEAVSLDENDIRMKSYQYSVLMHYKFNSRLSGFPIDTNDEVIANWEKEQRDIRREIMNTLPEHYGIKTSGYYLPQIECNLYLYKEFKEETKERTKRIEDINTRTYWQDICFFFEETTEDIHCDNGGESLINKLYVFRGVREEDIKLKNARFQGYLYSLRELGNLPDFRNQ